MEAVWMDGPQNCISSFMANCYDIIPLESTDLPESKIFHREHQRMPEGHRVSRILDRAVVRWIVAALFCLVVLHLVAADSYAQKKSRRQRAVIEMNFKNVDIANFLSIMSQTLGIAMVWDETKIRGNITLISPKKFTKRDAKKIFETVLAMHGYTTIQRPGSPLVQVVPTQDAPRLPSPTRQDKKGVKGEGFFLTQIIPLQYADANQVRAALTPLISKSAGLAVYAPGNILVLSDTQSNIRRIMAIVKEMDVPPADVVFFVLSLKHASAKKLAPILTALGGTLPQVRTARRAPGGQTARSRATAAGRKGQVKVVADERTNTLILVGPPRLLEKFKEIIATLDIPGVVQEKGVRVIHLEHADATELVKILKDINIKTPGKGVKGPQGGASRAQVSKATITADKATNAIIMFGPSEVLDTLASMVAQLDVRRPQVYVEVLIMEMTLEKSLNLGVRWQATGEVENGIVGGGFPDSTPRSLEGALAAGTGSAIGIIGDQITFSGEKFTSFSGFIQATRQDQDLNVLANPQLLTLNNQEAEINVSQVVPVSTKTTTNNQLQTTTEFEFKDVGIILSITPQITGKNKVRLLIKQESSSIAAKQALTSSTQTAITTLKRKINTQVVVDDNTTMAIGGLIHDQVVETETKVPCLGDIPLIGWLFKSTSEQIEKINLIVFIRPRIISTREQLEESTRRVHQRFDEVTAPKVKTGDLLRKSFGLPPRPEPPKDEDKKDKSEEEGANAP